jgi:hypothetical protein
MPDTYSDPYQAETALARGCANFAVTSFFGWWATQPPSSRQRGIAAPRRKGWVEALSATVILVCLDGPVKITVQVRVAGITGSNKPGTKPVAGWVRRITVNTWSRSRSWIDPDMPGPDMLAPVGFIWVVDGYDFTGNFGDRRRPRDWRSKCDSGGNQQRRAGDCKHYLSHRSLSIPSWDTRGDAPDDAQAVLFRIYSSRRRSDSREKGAADHNFVPFKIKDLTHLIPGTRLSRGPRPMQRVFLCA